MWMKGDKNKDKKDDKTDTDQQTAGRTDLSPSRSGERGEGGDRYAG